MLKVIFDISINKLFSHSVPFLHLIRILKTHLQSLLFYALSKFQFISLLLLDKNRVRVEMLLLNFYTH